MSTANPNGHLMAVWVFFIVAISVISSVSISVPTNISTRLYH